MSRGILWRAAFSLLGLGSLAYILHGYGFARLGQDLAGLGWWSVPLALSWAPVVACYALAWLLVTPELGPRHAGSLFRMMIISVAWNNLSPFVKVLGEPVRMVMLRRWLDGKAAARSTLLFNIVHMTGTLLAFFFGALAILLLFPVAPGVRAGFVVLIAATPILTAVLYMLPHLVRGRGKRAHRNKLVIAGFWLRWSLSKIRIFSGRHPARFWAAVVLEVAARFVEGLTFFIAFHALGEPASVVVSALLDVGRALVDNVFFFIPYQVGSREGGIVLLAEHALHVNAQAAVAAAVMYRLVEILWMGIGYLLWIAETRSRRPST